MLSLQVFVMAVPTHWVVISRDVVSASRRSRDVVSKRLGLVETWEGLGLDLVSNWKSNVLVSSRSRTIGSRLQANMHNFLLHCKTAPTSFLVTWTHVHVRYMVSPVRLSSVCVKRSCTLLRRLKFSAIFLRHVVPWLSTDVHEKFHGHRPRETPLSGELNTTGLAKYRDFGPIKGHISETVQDRRQVSINH